MILQLRERRKRAVRGWWWWGREAYESDHGKRHALLVGGHMGGLPVIVDWKVCNPVENLHGDGGLGADHEQL
jgi:hypothetical protein